MFERLGTSLFQSISRNLEIDSFFSARFHRECLLDERIDSYVRQLRSLDKQSHVRHGRITGSIFLSITRNRTVAALT